MCFRMNLVQDIMENQRGKGLSFARRIYLPRIIGLGIGCISVAAALYPLSLADLGLGTAAIQWLCLAAPGLSTVDPLDFSLQGRTPQPTLRFAVWRFLGGDLQFNPLTTVTILAMMASE